MVKEKKIPTRIMVFGTFDGVHKGHLDFFRQAKKISKKSFLIVSIARDKNVLRIKGELPVFKEKKRLALVKKIKIVNKAVLSGKNNHLPHILKEKPHIIALGYDQNAYIKNLKKNLENKGVPVKIVRLRPYREHIYKNRLLKTKKRIQ